MEMLSIISTVIWYGAVTAVTALVLVRIMIEFYSVNVDFVLNYY